MQYFTFPLMYRKQSEEAQRWLDDVWNSPENGFGAEMDIDDGIVTHCRLIVDTEKVEVILQPFPQAFHILEGRFHWTQVTWFPYAYGQVFQLKPKRGKQLWIATSLVLESNKLVIGAK